MLPQVMHLLTISPLGENMAKPVCLYLQDTPFVHSPFGPCHHVHGDTHDEVVVEKLLVLSLPLPADPPARPTDGRRPPSSLPPPLPPPLFSPLTAFAWRFSV